MATGAGIEGVEGPIRRLFGDGSASGMDVGELLRRFASGRDPVALEVLVARFGPMVLGVCRRVLGDRHSSDDAFQATFLILAKKAGSIRDPDRLGPWLHGVAHRVAVRARADLARQKARERPGAEDLAMATPADEAGFDRLELRAALDEEIRKLPEKFRDPIVLCYLDGLTHDEAANRLRCPVGTVRSRLSTGRARLRERLARRGVAVPTAVFATALAAEAAPAAVSLPLLTSTVTAATAFAGGLATATAAGMVPATVASLAEGVSTTMILSKLKVVAGLALSGMLTVGLGTVAAYQAGGSGQEPKAEKPAVEPDQKGRNDQIMQVGNEIRRLQEERDRIVGEMETAQKKLSALFWPDGPPPASQKLEAPAPTTAATLRYQIGATTYKKSPPGTFQADDYVIVHKPGSDKVAGYSATTGEWSTYAVPKGVEIRPITGPGVVALMVTGDEIGQIAAFVPATGRWYPFDLKEPAQGKVNPSMGSGGQAAYVIGRRVYAFSAPSQSWDLLELPEGSEPNPVIFSSRTSVEHDDHIYIFSGKTGKWADFDAGAGRPPVPKPD